MPFSYEFKLNKVKITGVEIGFTTTRKWEEALDEAKLSLPFMETDSPLSMLGLLQIEVNEFASYANTSPTATKTYDFLVYSDVIQEATKYGMYRHELSLIEYTAKLDYYIMPSLAKSRSIISNVQAPFTVDNFINAGTNDAYQISIRLPYLDVKTTYFSNTEITFPYVEEAFIALNSTGPNYRRGGTYISTNATLLQGTKPHNLSGGGTTWKFPKGKWELYYGWVSQAGDSAYAGEPDQYGFHPLYTFHINVIDSNELTMYDVIEEIRSCVSRFGGIEDTVYFDATRVFKLSTNDEIYLKTIKAPQMYLENATARQMLIFALSYINGLPRLEWGEQIDTLKVEKYNLSMGVFAMDDIVSRSGQQNTNQIGSRSVSRINQALPNNMNNPSVYMPSQSGKVQVRATVQQITASEFEIKLPESKPIYTPTDLLVGIDDLVVTNTETSETFNFGDIDLSLMARFINRDEWFLKFITNDFPNISASSDLEMFDNELGMRPNRISNLSWQVGDTSIKLSNVYGALFQSTLIRNVVIEAIREYVTLRIPISSDSSTMYKNYTVSYTIPGVDDYKDWRFRVEYITDESLLIKQEKEDISQINFYSEMRHNQDESLVNIVRQSRKGYGDLQRTGNVGYSFTKMHTSLSQEYSVGQRDVNGFTINEIHTEWHNNYFMNTYVVTKHHNRISQATFVDQTYRWRDNYAKTSLKRHEHYGDYLVVTPPDETQVAELPNKVYSNYTVKIAMGMLFGSGYITQKTKATMALIRTDGMLNVYDDDSSTRKFLNVPVSSFGIKGGFVFTFGFDNNQVAGDGLVERGTGKWYNQAVRYTDEEGRFTRFGFWIVRDRVYGADDIETYPMISLDEADESLYLGLYDITTQYFGCGFITDNFSSGEPMVVNKDPLTNYNQTYQLNVISHYQGLYVFGLKFYTDNLLVVNDRSQSITYLYIYRNGERYEMFEDIFIKNTYESRVLLNEETMTFDLATLRLEFFGLALELLEDENTTSWAIGNAQKDLYIACNEPLNGLKIFKTHVRPDIWEIGVKAFSAKFYTLDSLINMGLSLGYERGKSLAYNFDSSIDFGLSMSYYRSKDIGLGVDGTLGVGLSLGYVKGKSTTLNMDSALALGLSLDYYKSKDIGFPLDMGASIEFNLSYSIGDAKVISIGSIGIGLSATLEYRRSKNIGFNLDSSIPLSLSIAFEKGYSLAQNIGGAMSLGMSMSYHKSKDIGLSISNSISMGLTVSTSIAKFPGFAIPSNINIGLSMGYSITYRRVSTPSITDKAITDAKDWGFSKESYWNAQAPSNRTTLTELPSAIFYAIGFALKVVDGTTSYYVCVKTGDLVSWKVVNNDEATITVYGKVGSSSYINYGTLASGATSNVLSRTVTDGQTTVYVYGTATGQMNSNIASS